MINNDLNAPEGECNGGATMHEQKKQPDYLLLVNAKNRIPEGYIETMELVPAENVAGDHFLVEKKTYEAYLALEKEIYETCGIQTVLLNSYRTIEMQTNSYNYYLKQRGAEYTQKYVALPGCSEHHTGLAIDVGILREGKVHRYVEELLEVEQELKKVWEKLPKYGFILRYPQGKEPVTGIGYEPWHFRYIDSPEIAREMVEKGICFEEYWQTK